MTVAELRVAAARAETYPPGHALNWGSDPLFQQFAGTVARFLEEHPELWESG